VDLLEQVSAAGGLDLSALLASPIEGHVRWQGQRNRRPSDHAAIDNAWVQPALAARAAGLPYSVEATIANKHRTLGARLAGELVWHGLHHKDTPLTFKMQGVAGQSFGAFAVPGMQLVLEGMANDFVGKGLCGGELILRGQGRAARESELHVILGNVALYGATSGSLFAAGRAGERFAVRNSGALAVVEGVGDHGCEYMTGGLVAVLGSTGQNFGAGMTGGLAWVFDEDGTFVSQTRYHTSFLTPEPLSQLDHEAGEELRQLILLHAEKTSSTRARWILSDWANLSSRFVRLTPIPQA
jgi:glutamate synthase (NADPH/NADH) large chain